MPKKIDNIDSPRGDDESKKYELLNFISSVFHILILEKFLDPLKSIPKILLYGEDF
jgi:hypothetical protein